MAEEHLWDRPLRILDYCCYSRLVKIDLEDYVRQCKRLHVNAVHFQTADCTGGGYDEDSLYFRSRHGRNMKRDLLGEAVPLMKDAGIRLIVYLNCHQFPKTFGDRHPDWWVVKEDGGRIENLYGSDDLTFCINSPWREYSYEVMEDICAYDIDGIFLDGPLAFPAERACYCDSCRNKFRRVHGREMPHWDRSNLGDWQMLMEFAQQSMEDYYAGAYARVKAVKPDAMVYLNACNESESNWLRGRNNRRLMPHQDALISEGGFHYSRLMSNPFHTAIASKLYATQAGDKQAINAVSPAYGPWRIHALSAPEIRILLSEASTGVGTYMAVYDEARDTPGIDAAAEVLAFLEANEDYYSGSQSAARVAILYSSQTVNAYRGGADIPRIDITGISAAKSDAITTFNRSFDGYFDMLVRTRVPFDVIDEVVIDENGLSRYDLVVLPNCACLSDSQCRLLTDYVRNGGRIIAEFETSHYDEWGVRREDFGLAEAFGLESTGRMVGPRHWDFAYVRENSMDCFPGLGQIDMPAPKYNLELKEIAAARHVVLGAQLISNIPASYPVTDDPMLTENAFGRGKTFYFSGLFGDAYKEHHFSPYLTVLRSIIRNEIPAQVEIEGPPHFLHVNLRRNEKTNCLMLHMVNYEISSVDAVIPANELRIRIHGVSNVDSVKALKSGQSLDFQTEGESIVFTLPQLDEYEVIAARIASG